MFKVQKEKLYQTRIRYLEKCVLQKWKRSKSSLKQLDTKGLRQSQEMFNGVLHLKAKIWLLKSEKQLKCSIPRYSKCIEEKDDWLNPNVKKKKHWSGVAGHVYLLSSQLPEGQARYIATNSSQWERNNKQ